MLNAGAAGFWSSTVGFSSSEEGCPSFIFFLWFSLSAWDIGINCKYNLRITINKCMSFPCSY